jgi:iron(III) transport system substrate-binding protein
MQHFSRKLFGLLFVLTLLVSACGGGTTVSGENVPETESAQPVENEAGVSGDLVIYSGRSESLIQPVLDAFQAKHPTVKILLKSGSNSELANALIEEQANPQADVFVTTEIFTIQNLYQQGLFASYRPAGADSLPPEFIGPDDSWIGLTRRARVIIYNTELVSAEEAPTSIFDLTDPKWKGQIAAAGSTNGGMQAQVAAMRQLLGDVDTQEWLAGLMANDVTFFGGHTDVRKAVGAGEFKIGLVNHYYYYLQQAEGSPVGIVFPDQGEGGIGLISNATSAAIVKGAKNVPAAQAFLDFLISEEGQKLFAELNYEYPLLPGVALKEGVQPLDGFRLADVNVAEAALDFNGTLDLMEAIGLP